MADHSSLIAQMESKRDSTQVSQVSDEPNKRPKLPASSSGLTLTEKIIGLKRLGQINDAAQAAATPPQSAQNSNNTKQDNRGGYRGGRGGGDRGDRGGRGGRGGDSQRRGGGYDRRGNSPYGGRGGGDRGGRGGRGGGRGDFNRYVKHNSHLITSAYFIDIQLS